MKNFWLVLRKSGSALDKLVSDGRDFILAEFVGTVVEKTFYQSKTTSEFAIKSKMSDTRRYRYSILLLLYRVEVLKLVMLFAQKQNSYPPPC